jgi:hypothetical protein
MTPFRKKLPAIAAATVLAGGAAAALAGCSSPSPGLTAPCAVVVDGSLSGKTFDAARSINDYVPIFLSKDRCKEVVFVPLDQSSRGSTCRQKAVDISPDLGPDVDQDQVVQAERGLALKRANAELTCAQKHEPAQGGSDVFGALTRAMQQRPTGTGITGTYHVLVVSDLIEYTTDPSLRPPFLDLSSTPQISSADGRNQLIGQLTRLGQVPNMTGVSVQVTDFGSGITSGQRSTYFMSFWTALFASAAAGNPQVSFKPPTS